jgi:uncharacterized protein YjiS (DUF1127 family)
MSLLTVFIAATNAWAGWRQRRRAYRELMALDDRLLADIGIRRTDISAIFDGKVRRESVAVQDAAMALSAFLAKLVFSHRGLPPVWPQL